MSARPVPDSTDVFALRKTGLDPFLFGVVGTETNGSVLTVVSLLARLDTDPWAEAARLSRLPRESVIEVLADHIRQMPLPPRALGDAKRIAARLARLLPAGVPDRDAPGNIVPASHWLPLTILYFAVTLGILVTGLLANGPAPASDAAAAVAPRALGPHGQD